jgi:predicted amidohydrolase YtcJ
MLRLIGLRELIFDKQTGCLSKKFSGALVFGALLVGVTPGFAQQPDANAPSLVLLNGKVRTMDPRSSVAEAVAIRGGKILAVGDSATIRSMAGPGTRTVDLAGKTVVPGLIDTHTHFKAAGMAGYVVDMTRAKTVAEALDAIKQFAATKPPGTWILGSAWTPPAQLAEKRYLTRQEIDSVAPNNPVYLRTVRHFSMANTLALSKAGVDRDTPDPSGGSFQRDARGELTGLVVETAIDRVEKAVPAWTDEDEFRQYKLAEGALNSYGITSAVEGATSARDIATLQKIALSGEATLRVGIMFRPEPPPENAAWEAIMRGNGASSGFGDDWLKFAAIKIFYDGGMTLKTALCIPKTSSELMT